MEKFEGNRDGSPLRVAVVCAKFYPEITDELLENCVNELRNLQVADENISIASVPGAFELPITAQAFALTGTYDAIICLGAVIRGETTHYDYVCEQAASGVLQMGLQVGVPVVFGVLTVENREQAMARLSKGKDFAQTAVEMATLLPVIEDHASIELS